AKLIQDGTAQWMRYEFHAIQGLVEGQNVMADAGRIGFSAPDGASKGSIRLTRRDQIDSETIALGESMLIVSKDWSEPVEPDGTPIYLSNPSQGGRLCRVKLAGHDANGR